MDPKQFVFSIIISSSIIIIISSSRYLDASGGRNTGLGVQTFGLLIFWSFGLLVVRMLGCLDMRFEGHKNHRAPT